MKEMERDNKRYMKIKIMNSQTFPIHFLFTRITKKENRRQEMNERKLRSKIGKEKNEKDTARKEKRMSKPTISILFFYVDYKEKIRKRKR